MADAVVAYDRELPEIPDRRPWEPPTSYLVKDDGPPTGWRVDDTGRRPSPLLLPPKIRAAVDAWRASGYTGASEVTRRLFAYWFDEDHEVVRPVLFIMAEKNVQADALGEYLRKTSEFGFEESEVLVIHIDNTGEVRKGDLERARQAARDIDEPGSRIKVIVSVILLLSGLGGRSGRRR